MKIREMLDRRTDLSTFVVHLTKRTTSSARENLRSILKGQTIRAVSAMGAAAGRLDPGTRDWNSQRVVCFTESPLEQLHSFFVQFEERRRHKFAPYGIAFTKLQARRAGVTPVWYTDTTWATNWRVNYVWNLIETAKTAGKFATSDIAQIAPFVETMGYAASGHKEFWWEREWRHLGNFSFGYEDIALGLCHEGHIDQFEKLMARIALRDPAAAGVRFIDPRWGLEQIIGRLAGVLPGDLSPFTI